MTINNDNRIAYVNNEFLRLEDAKISILDRGFLFGDGIYEVVAVLNGTPIDEEAHLSRLERSLREINLPHLENGKHIKQIIREIIKKNNLHEGLVYFQITRGSAERDFAYPKDVNPSLVMFTQSKTILKNKNAETGVKVHLFEDLRWKRRDIKSIAMIAQTMAKQAAIDHDSFEAWMYEDGFITEGSSSTAFIIKDNQIITRQLGNEILPGCTRKAVLKICQTQNLAIAERPFSIEEAIKADEAFLTSASTFVMPVTSIDDTIIGIQENKGKPGKITKLLRQAYIEEALKETV